MVLFMSDIVSVFFQGTMICGWDKKVGVPFNSFTTVMWESTGSTINFKYESVLYWRSFCFDHLSRSSQTYRDCFGTVAQKIWKEWTWQSPLESPVCIVKNGKRKLSLKIHFHKNPLTVIIFLYVNCHSGTCRIVKFNFYINTFYSTDDEL